MQLFIVFLLLRHKWFKTAKKPETYINNSFLNVFFCYNYFFHGSFDYGLHEMTIFFALFSRKSLFCELLRMKRKEFCAVCAVFVQESFVNSICWTELTRNLVCRTVFQKSSVNRAMKELSKIYSFLWTKLLRVIQFLHRVIKSFRSVFKGDPWTLKNVI